MELEAMEQETVLLTSAAVVRVACAKLGSAIGDGAAVMVGGPNLRGDLEGMKTTLENIGAALEGAEERFIREEERSIREEVRRWLKRVKEAAYDICDMLNDLQANDTTPPAANTIRTRMLTRLAIVPNATMIANRTKNMIDNLRVILQESPSFISAIRSSYASEGPLYSRRETPPPPHIILEETNITGRDEDKQNIMLAVLSAADNMREGTGPIILPIVGVGGIGKTTLAKLVSDDARFKDYTKVWVSASDNFEMGRCIISQLSAGAESKDSNDMESIMGRLNELLGGKKVLVVLDDLGFRGDFSELERLRHMLSPSDSKVIVIVTTRNQDIARGICTLRRPYELHPLTDDMCWTIIKQKSAFEARADKQELEQIGRMIANKLRGLPLAAQVLGLMLRSKHLREWSMVNENDDVFQLALYPSMLSSYRNMPPSLRLCFAYCAIFPRGHSIARDELIRQWIALDFIQPSDRFSTTRLAEEHITTLLGMSFLEPTKSASTSGKDDKGAVFLTMHDDVRYFARLLFRDEVFVVDHIYEISHKPLNLSSILNARLRAVHFLGCSEMELLSDGAFSSAKRLHVLDLRDCPMHKLPDSICQLRQLRYLNLSGRSELVNLSEPFGGLKNLVYLYLSGCSGLVKLPESFGKLENLVYLDLSGCSGLVKLSESFGKLKNLMHLDLSGCSVLVELSESFGKLKNLVHLDLSGCFGLVELPYSFGKLKNLVHLDLSFCSCFEGIPAALRGLTKLHHLNLSHSCCYLVEHRFHLKGLRDVWGKLTKLKYLNLSMCLNPILCYLPEKESLEYIKSMSGLSSLEHLDLSHNIFLCDLPESLGKLNKLHTLDLSGCIRLKRMNKWMGKMNPPKFLVMRNCRGLENYQFVVRADDGEYRSKLVQFEEVNPKGLEISCLENVKTIEEAQRIRLVDKRNLERLTLAWTVGSHRFVEDNALFGELVPPHNLRCLELHGYNGTCLLAWTLSLSSPLPNLVEVTMEDIPRCSRLPPLGLLPKLRQVVLRRMASVTRIDACDLIGGNRVAAFPRLSKFTLDDMKRLEEWNTTYYRGGEELMFPAIDELVIKCCPKLLRSACSTSAPVTKLVIESCEVPLCRWSFLHCLPSLHSLSCKNCSDLTTISPEIIGVLSSLHLLCFSHCDSMTSLPEYLGDLNSLQELQIVCCKQLQSLPDSMKHLTSLQWVHFSDCESITALPEWFGGLNSLQKLAIHKCHAIKSLPQSIRKLTNLKDLHIVDCPELKKWCESEENKNSLAHIRPKYEEHVYSKRLSQIQRSVSILSD